MSHPALRSFKAITPEQGFIKKLDILLGKLDTFRTTGATTVKKLHGMADAGQFTVNLENAIKVEELNARKAAAAGNLAAQDTQGADAARERVDFLKNLKNKFLDTLGIYYNTPMDERLIMLDLWDITSAIVEATDLYG